MDATTTTTTNLNNVDNEQRKFNENNHHRNIFVVFNVFVIIFFLLIILLIISYILLFHKIANDSDQLNNYIDFYLKNWPNIIIQLLTLMALSSACLLATFAIYLLRDQFKCQSPLNFNSCYEEQTTTIILDDQNNSGNTITKRSDDKQINEMDTVAVTIDKQIIIH
ncbi:hypothetical protein HUG17_10186 [Dermatophagoides farinae]|uniref:Uncharacterized protein n=1 Tax=Dermatophagoides farinae TaxID=6954 RepID=A0A9D4SC23_DERFA|nr:hypothetical protein HUG17_10186 [Dermatophagoides farinae]